MYAAMKTIEIWKLPVLLKCIVSSYNVSSSGVLNNRVRETSISGCRLSLPGVLRYATLVIQERQQEVICFPIYRNLISHYHIYIFEYLFPSRDD